MKKPTPDQPSVNQDHGDLLIKLARTTIGEHLGVRMEQDMINAARDAVSQPGFSQKAGTFVTLHVNKKLRGCIGTIEPDETIIQGIKSNAVNAAFHDPRFSPLSKKEFNNIDIEVSLLTRPKKLNYIDAQDLLNRLRPLIDGVILEKSYSRATFLPQVWEQLPDPRDFLKQLCIKAGLPGDEWEKGKITVSTYQVTSFEENSSIPEPRPGSS